MPAASRPQMLSSSNIMVPPTFSLAFIMTQMRERCVAWNLSALPLLLKSVSASWVVTSVKPMILVSTAGVVRGSPRQWRKKPSKRCHLVVRRIAVSLGWRLT